jgi:hypothetical protein
MNAAQEEGHDQNEISSKKGHKEITRPQRFFLNLISIDSNYIFTISNPLNGEDVLFKDARILDLTAWVGWM